MTTRENKNRIAIRVIYCISLHEFELKSEKKSICSFGAFFALSHYSRFPLEKNKQTNKLLTLWSMLQNEQHISSPIPEPSV